MYQSGRTRARILTPTLGLPSLETLTDDAPFEPDPREQVKAWWLNMGRLALMSLSLAALSGCGGGSAEIVDRCKTTGAWAAQNEAGPVVIIARACRPGGGE